MSALARKKRFDGPVRMKFAVATGYTPTGGDRVTVTANSLEVNKIADTAKPVAFIGEIYDTTADGNAEYCIVELVYNNAESVPAEAVITAPGPGVFTGQKVASYDSGSDTANEITCVILETAAAEDDEVIVIW